MTTDPDKIVMTYEGRQISEATLTAAKLACAKRGLPVYEFPFTPSSYLLVAMDAILAERDRNADLLEALKRLSFSGTDEATHRAIRTDPSHFVNVAIAKAEGR